MKLQRVLDALFRAVTDETERNPEFARRIEEALELGPEASMLTKSPSDKSTAKKSRPANRRDAATFDPLEIARQGEDILRARLAGLDLKQLKDIVAEYGMDAGKSVMRSRTTSKIIEHIVESATRRVKRGEAFLA